MTSELPPLEPEEPGPVADPVQPPAKRRIATDPAATLNLAMVVYIFIDMLFALPLLIFPVAFFDFIGMDTGTAEDLGAFRWVGAMLLAWAVSGIFVLARPGGRAIFVTTGALQLSLAALAFLYSWSLDEYTWSVAYHLVATLILVLGSVVLWWARFVGRTVFRNETEKPSGRTWRRSPPPT